ncbi:MAG: hypothetical protein HC806_03720 [Anaerolineae bacterium]|nr:hypothetical protein [Anaerolineae bacterium]
MTNPFVLRLSSFAEVPSQTPPQNHPLPPPPRRSRAEMGRIQPPRHARHLGERDA